MHSCPPHTKIVLAPWEGLLIEKLRNFALKQRNFAKTCIVYLHILLASLFLSGWLSWKHGGWSWDGKSCQKPMTALTVVTWCTVRRFEYGKNNICELRGHTTVRTNMCEITLRLLPENNINLNLQANSCRTKANFLQCTFWKGTAPVTAGYILTIFS